MKNRVGIIQFLCLVFLLSFRINTLAAQEPSAFSAEKAYDHIRYLTQKVGARPAGSKGEQRAAKYIYYVLEQAGWKVQEQSFNKVVVPNNPLQKDYKVQIVSSQNVVAELPGKSPETILLGAHYDTADINSPGAVDNASGVGVLLEIARILSREPRELTYQIVFFGAEEYGLVGSSYYVSQADLSAVNWMLNLDMTGLPLEVDVAGKKSAPPELVEKVISLARKQKVPFHLSRDFMVMTRDSSLGGNSDFSPFLDQGIPAIGLGIAGRPGGFYHRPEDQLENIRMESLQQVGEYVEELVTTVRLAGSGTRIWDELYLTFQLRSWVLILPTIGLRILYLIIFAVTGVLLVFYVRKLKQNPVRSWRRYIFALLVTYILSLISISIGRIGEVFWKWVKGLEVLWFAYPGFFLAARIIIAFCFILVIGQRIFHLSMPHEPKIYWFSGVIMLLILSFLTLSVRVDLCFPFIFWLLCFNLLWFFPSMILTFIGPYFLYHWHWELLNSQQWLGFYETFNDYPLIFVILYSFLLTPLVMAGFYVGASNHRLWSRILSFTERLGIIGLILVILGLGLVPNYTKDYPQIVTVREEWKRPEKGDLHIFSKERLPDKLLKGFKVPPGKSILIPAFSYEPPMSIQLLVTDKHRSKYLSFNMNYHREPYLVRLMFASSKPFRITEIDDFLPAKLPRKFQLEGREKTGVYQLILERTPPHRNNVQLSVERQSTIDATVEVVFADFFPLLKLNEPKISADYEVFYQAKFEF